MNLDDELRDIFVEIEDEIGPMEGTSSRLYRDRIKQVFTDAGYIQVSSVNQEQQAAIANMALGNRVMTDQEWYDRFEKEIASVKSENHPLYDKRTMLYIARRAAGIGETAV